MLWKSEKFPQIFMSYVSSDEEGSMVQFPEDFRWEDERIATRSKAQPKKRDNPTQKYIIKTCSYWYLDGMTANGLS
jgi:hypothetical protein